MNFKDIRKVQKMVAVAVVFLFIGMTVGQCKQEPPKPSKPDPAHLISIPCDLKVVGTTWNYGPKILTRPMHKEETAETYRLLHYKFLIDRPAAQKQDEELVLQECKTEGLK